MARLGKAWQAWLGMAGLGMAGRGMAGTEPTNGRDTTMASLVETLTTIRQTAGKLTPAAVVEASTPDDAPLHHRFEWDDHAAGHKYRLSQASDLIRQAKVQFVDKRGDEKAVRAFIAIRDNAPEPADDYMPVQEVVANPDLHAIARREYMSALRSLKSQYGHLEDFAEIAARELGVAA